MTQPGIEPRSPGSLVNTLLIRPMIQLFVYDMVKNEASQSALCQIHEPQSTLTKQYFKKNYFAVFLLLYCN